jgi:NADH-quinone oxidoreductase subunit L
MGGLKKVMPKTALLMTLASVALAGIFPLAGFFSKDKILEVAFAEHHQFLWGILWVTAGLTAFYSFRLVMLVFYGEEKYKKLGFHPHEVPNYVIYAMTPLAFLAVTSGWLEHSFFEFVKKTLPGFHPHIEHSTVWILIAVTTSIAVGGILFAVKKYQAGGFSKMWEDRPCYKLLDNQYYIPKIYEVLITRPYYALSKVAWKEVDLKIIDATVDGIAKTIHSTGDKARIMQSGNLSTMLKWMVAGLVVLLLSVVIFSPVR